MLHEVVEEESRNAGVKETHQKTDVRQNTSGLTVVRMKSGLKLTPSPHRFISSGVGSFLATRAVADSLLPPFTTAKKSSTMLPLAVFSGERQTGFTPSASATGITPPYPIPSSHVLQFKWVKAHLLTHSAGHCRIHLQCLVTRKRLVCWPRSSGLPAYSACSLPSYKLEKNKTSVRWIFFNCIWMDCFSA